MTQLVTEVYFENGVCIAAFSHILLVLLLLLLLQPFNGLFFTYTIVVMVAVWLLLSSFSFVTSPILSRHILDVYHTFIHDVALVQI